jgi:hypothetical protein
MGARNLTKKYREKKNEVESGKMLKAPPCSNYVKFFRNRRCLKVFGQISILRISPAVPSLLINGKIFENLL